MNEVEVLKIALSKQASRIANLSLDLDLAHAQIDILTKQIEKKGEEAE